MEVQTVIDALGTGLQQACNFLDSRVVRDAEKGPSPYSGLDEFIAEAEWL